MKNKKLKILSATAAAMLITVPLAADSVFADNAYDNFVDGGRITVDFENGSDIALFNRYTEFGDLPYIMDGRLYGWTLAEQKIILKGKIFEDVRVDVDISAIGKNGKFDSGVYIGASNVNSAKDGITAWNVNIEHGVNASTFWLKLHRFENNRWIQSEMVEIGGLVYTADTVHLRVVVKDGTLHAFLNDGDAPVVSQYIGNEARGMVGLRNYYSPNYFDNFTVTGDALDADFADMNALLAVAETRVEDNIVPECKTELNAAIALAKAAATQAQADNAVSALASALDRAENLHTFSELTALIRQADGITNVDGEVYTVNSYNAFVAVKNVCASLTDEDSEYDISYWYARLDDRMENLIAY